VTLTDDQVEMTAGEMIEAFLALGSPFVADGMQKAGLSRRIADPAIRPLFPERRIAGTVVTFRMRFHPTPQQAMAYSFDRAFRFAALVGQLDQTRGHLLGFFTDAAHADFTDDLQSRQRGVIAGNVGRAMHEFVRRLTIVGSANFKCERIFMREPTGQSRFQLLRQIRTHI
jgi:hypothetical protein